MAKLTEAERAMRLLRRIDFSNGADGCWLWTGARTGEHGVVNWHGRSTGAYRALWQLIYGPVPEGLALDHLCMNPICVNPAHLEPVTPGENIRRAFVAYGHWGSKPDKCKHGHDLSDVYIDPAGRRQCRACKRRNRLEKHYRDYVRLGNANARKTHCKHGHEYTPDNTHINAHGHRSCKACRNEAVKRHYWRLKERQDQ